MLLFSLPIQPHDQLMTQTVGADETAATVTHRPMTTCHSVWLIVWLECAALIADRDKRPLIDTLCCMFLLISMFCHVALNDSNHLSVVVKVD